MEKEVFIVGATRTPIGEFGGALKTVSATQLAMTVMNSVVSRAGIEKSDLQLVTMGNCMDPVASNVARIASVQSGIPFETPAVSVSCTCGSGMQAIINGFLAIRNRDAQVVLAGGVESMSNAPYILPAGRWGQRLQHAQLVDLIWKQMQEYPIGVGMGLTAENLAERDNISRQAQDELALASQTRALHAIDTGRFKDEITPVEIPVPGRTPKIVDTDEHPRRGLTMEKLATLPAVFKKGGTVTAANSSGINDGAAAVILMDGDRVKETGAKPLARIIGYSVAGVDPSFMGIGPVPATRMLLEKTGLSMVDIDLIELNEAFAAQYLSCEKGLQLDRNVTNVNGSGIALGHPVGCTGCRLVVSLIYEMQKSKLHKGLATLCAGGGQGFAMIIERL
jgi:acetyl-CoA C-acetyltransferase